MKRSRLRNKFLNTKSDIDRKAYNKQRNLCVSLIRSEKKNFFSNINTCDITDNKTFWKTVKPFFTDKIKTKSKITLIEKKVVSQEGQEEIVSEKIITEDQAVAEVFNKFFINIVPNLKISTDRGYDNDFIATDDQVANAVNKFRNHSSIIMIKNKKKNDQSFSFGPVTYDDVLKKVNTLDTAKASQQSDIPTKILKQNSDYFAEYFYENINQCISKSVFPSDLKLADVTPVYKKKSKNSKDNYRPVSILSNISKIYERCIYDQIQLFFDSVLSKYQCGFRRGYNAQHCLVSLIEKWKKSVDNRITYQDNASTFEELLNKDNSVSIHHRNLQVLATEMFKIHRGLSPEILRETFVPKTSSYNLRRNDTFKKVKCTLFITVLNRYRF